MRIRSKDSEQTKLRKQKRTQDKSKQNNITKRK